MTTIVDRLVPVPQKSLPGDFRSAVALLNRPYIRLTPAQYQAVVEKAKDTDILLLDGRQVTFGDADGGYALMPLIQPI